jgi:thiol:disulfide interchange protein DsbD
LIPEFGSTIKIISGFNDLQRKPVRSRESKGGSNASSNLPEGAHLGPHDLIAFEDYEKGLAYANKNLFYLILQDMHVSIVEK